MLESIVRLICEILMSILGIYVLKNLLNIKEKTLNKKTVFLLGVLTIIPTVLYKIEYNYSYTLIIYLLAIVIYKQIFKRNIYQIILSTGIFMILVLASDVLVSSIAILFLSDGIAIRECWYISLIANIMVDVIVMLIIKIKKIQMILSEFIEKFSASKYLHMIVFLSAVIISITIFISNFNTVYSKNMSFLANIITIFLMILIAYIFIQEKINFNHLTDKYDTLYQYVQTFETWVENEQLNRHEYKNQLAVIRSMTKEKEVKEKIDSLICNTINLNNDMIESLKDVPNGGLKGLLYYKVALAARKNIKLTIDVSKKVKSKLKVLRKEQIKDLSNLIGIYFDNAIEANTGLKKKQITLEIYEINNTINFVISNKFNENSIVNNCFEKGITSKGKNRGNGLYFAKKIIERNTHIKQECKVINNFYIQKLMISI